VARDLLYIFFRKPLQVHLLRCCGDTPV